jgi:type II secretion system protein D
MGAAACCLAAAAALTAGPASGQQPADTGRATVSTDRPIQRIEHDTPEIRLTFVSTPWPKVLEKLAEECGLQLVMHDAPSGRFTRNDWQKHTKDEALRIINRELETLGFRALANDRFLTVIRTEQARVEYPRREVPSGTSEGTARARSGPAAASGRAGVQTAGYELETTPSQPPIVWTAGETSAPEAKAAPAQSPAAAEPTSTRVAPQTRLAIEISRDIFEAFETNASVRDRGPNGLPAFTVWRNESPKAAAERREWFTLELDTERNAIVINAVPTVAKGLAELIGRLDVAPQPDGQATRLLTGRKSLPAIGRQLQPQLGLLKEGGQARAAAWQPGAVQPQGSQPRPETLPPGQQPSAPGVEVPFDQGQIGPGTALAPGMIPGIIGNLRGDVSIQSIDDLNLLIIRGNEADVQQVLEVINAIELVAQGTTPEIRLHILDYVDSESLSTLLNDVYTQLGTQQEDRGRTPPSVNVIPVVQPNAILILAPATAMEAIIGLATALDAPSDPAAEVEFIRLRNAIATQAVEQLNDFYEDRPGLGTSVRAVADPRTNTVIVQARPRELSEVRRFLKGIDRDSVAASMLAQSFPLRHASATELAEFLSTTIQNILNPQGQTGQAGLVGGAGGENAQALRDAKSVVLELLLTNGDVKRLVRSGLLADIRITGDPRTNTLLVTSSKESMPVIAELIKLLDQPSGAVASVKMISLRNADAVAAVEVLTNLFEPQTEDQVGVTLVGAEEASSLVPLRFEADPRSNTVIAYGAQEALTMVEAILLRLDAADLRDRQVNVLKLRNAPAADVAAAINQFLQSQRDLLQIDPDRVSTFELLEQEIIVTAEPVNNYLIISATPKYYDQILAMAQKLDSEPAQVMIQALLVEVELNDTDEFGVELGFQDSVLFNRSVIDNILTISQTNTSPNGVQTTTQRIISQSATPGFLFNNQPLGNNTAVSPGTVGSQGLSNFGVGRVNGDLGFGGLVLSASSESVNVLIRALASRRNVRILSRPQVLALDNQTAQIQVGQQVPIVDGVTVSDSGIANPNVVQDEAGIILTVTPRISPEGQIVMEVAAEKSAFTGAGVPIFTDTAGNVFESPIKDITTALSTVKVPDGQTIVVGGMITKADETIERKVPYLGDIPILNYLFRYDSHTERRTELLIFLTPRVVWGDTDAELIKQVEAERLHFFEEEAEAIHGPLYSVPPEQSAGPVDPNCPPGTVITGGPGAAGMGPIPQEAQPGAALPDLAPAPGMTPPWPPVPMTAP